MIKKKDGFRIASGCFLFLAFVLSHAMCAVVAYNWCLVEASARNGGMFPPEASLIFSWPFLIGIGFCLLLWRLFANKSSMREARGMLDEYKATLERVEQLLEENRKLDDKKGA